MPLLKQLFHGSKDTKETGFGKELNNLQSPDQLNLRIAFIRLATHNKRQENPGGVCLWVVPDKNSHNGVKQRNWLANNENKTNDYSCC
jgi:hypothetical protein